MFDLCQFNSSKAVETDCVFAYDDAKTVVPVPVGSVAFGVSHKSEKNDVSQPLNQ